MEERLITELLLSNAMVLAGQPKWTFGKNTCNTYEVFVSHFRNPDGTLMASWPILEVVERDRALSQIFSAALLQTALLKTAEVSQRGNANLTLSLNLLPSFAESKEFVGMVGDALAKSGLQAKRLQFEVSELQDLSPEGCAHLNQVHDELGIGLVMGNFGTRRTNMPLLCQVHFDMLELDRSYAARVPQEEQSCKAIIAIQHMADTLGMTLCAKGIETQDQFEFFEEIGTFKGQGSLIGNPMSMEELEAYVRRYALEKGHK